MTAPQVMSALQDVGVRVSLSREKRNLGGFASTCEPLVELKKRREARLEVCKTTALLNSFTWINESNADLYYTDGKQEEIKCEGGKKKKGHDPTLTSTSVKREGASARAAARMASNKTHTH